MSGPAHCVCCCTSPSCSAEDTNSATCAATWAAGEGGSRGGRFGRPGLEVARGTAAEPPVPLPCLAAGPPVAMGVCSKLMPHTLQALACSLLSMLRRINKDVPAWAAAATALIVCAL